MSKQTVEVPVGYLKGLIECRKKLSAIVGTLDPIKEASEVYYVIGFMNQIETILEQENGS